MSTQDDINRLVRPDNPAPRLAAAKTPDAIREKTGLERKTAGQVGSEEVTVQSTDGLFTFAVRVVSS